VALEFNIGSLGAFNKLVMALLGSVIGTKEIPELNAQTI